MSRGENGPVVATDAVLAVQYYTVTGIPVLAWLIMARAAGEGNGAVGGLAVRGKGGEIVQCRS